MSSRVAKVAAIQLNSQDNVENNLIQCRRLIEVAAASGSDIVVLPENFAFIGAEADKARVAERLEDGPISTLLRQLARDNGIVLVAGGIPELSNDPARPYNTCAVFGQDGNLLTRYRKIHLFDVDLQDGTRLSESSATTAGSEAELVEIKGFHLGLSICYDLRFPELYRQLVNRGADVLLVPAAFTLHTGKDHWHVLLRARAIESQCWVVAAAQWGKHPRGRASYGHSMIIDPWGVTVAECSDRVGWISAEIDGDLIDEVRRVLPSLRHRRL